MLQLNFSKDQIINHMRTSHFFVISLSFYFDLYERTCCKCQSMSLCWGGGYLSPLIISFFNCLKKCLTVISVFGYSRKLSQLNSPIENTKFKTSKQ